jgi:hypothetical protein
MKRRVAPPASSATQAPSQPGASGGAPPGTSDPMLARVVVTHGVMAYTADDVARHCVVAAAPNAVELGGQATFVPNSDVPPCRSAVAALLDVGARRTRLPTDQ